MVDTISSAIPAAQTASQVDSAALSQDFDDFLSLLTTQLQNQDPLDPLDSNEFTNQLVQFSQVEQQIAANGHLEDLVGLQDLSLTSVVLGYIGLNVEVVGDTFAYEEGPYQAFYELPSGGADSVEITIFDENNQPVFETVGANDTGRHEVIWDGLDLDGNQVEPGTYRISVQAQDSENNAVPVQTSVTAQVDGIETVNGQLLLTADDLLIPFSSITSASVPPEASPAEVTLAETTTPTTEQ